MRKPLSASLVALMSVLSFASTSPAAEVGHYVGGLVNIRDLQVPAAPGFYAAVYNYYYQTGRVNDANGNERDSVTIHPGPGPGLTLDLDPDVDVYALAPALIWVSDWKILGASYGALLLTTFGNASVGASLSTQLGQGLNAETSQFGIGDWYFQPIWLGWHLEHFDFSLAYGFYAPTGKYDTEPREFSAIGTFRVESADNIGLGFWTNQFQGAATWYPWASKATAVALALTWEINSEKEDFHVTPGQVVSLNWGVSQYLPLNAAQTWLVELGPAGYDQWQVTSDDGRNASNGLLDQVHAAGVQVGITSVELTGSINFHFFREFYSEDRFEGNVFGLGGAMHF
jgi:hypothetical protein